MKCLLPVSSRFISHTISFSLNWSLTTDTVRQRYALLSQLAYPFLFLSRGMIVPHQQTLSELFQPKDDSGIARFPFVVNIAHCTSFTNAATNYTT